MIDPKLEELVNRLEELVTRLEEAVKVTPNKIPEDPLTDARKAVAQRAAQALRDVMVWTCLPLSILQKEQYIGIDRRTLAKVLKGEASQSICRKVILYRKKYAEMTGRVIKNDV